MSSIARLTPFIMCFAALSVAGAAAQSTEKKETLPTGLTSMRTTRLQGEVVAVGPSWLVAKMVPGRQLSRLRRQTERGGHD